MIGAAVARGIREMERDPKRSVRRLADLGRQFSSSRFQELVFTIMQQLLANEQSSYYEMMENLLKNTDHEAMKLFGVDLGYNVWTYGARVLRTLEEERGVALPWVMLLQYDPTRADGLTAAAIEKIVAEGSALGIYAYYIRQCGAPSDSSALPAIFAKYPDCAFVWLPAAGTLTQEQIGLLQSSRNAMVCLPAEDRETLQTAAQLRAQKVLFGLCARYRADNWQEVCGAASFQTVTASQAAFFFLVAEDASRACAGQFCYDSRLKQEYPCFVMDYYADARSISRILADHDALLEIGPDGRLVQPAERAGERFSLDKPLAEALGEAMPKLKQKK